MFVGGIIFVLMSDLTYLTAFTDDGNAPSIYLIATVLLAFGSAVIFFFANNYVEKPWAMYLMKGIGLALGVGLIIYYHWFSGCKDYINAMNKLQNYGLAKASVYAASKACIIITLILAYIAVVVQAVNIVLTATLNEDKDVEKAQQETLATEEVVADEAASEALTDEANAEA